MIFLLTLNYLLDFQRFSETAKYGTIWAPESANEERIDVMVLLVINPGYALHCVLPTQSCGIGEKNADR